MNRRRAAAVSALAAATLAGAGLFLFTLPYGLVWDDRILLKHVADVVRNHGVPGLFAAKFLPEVTAEYYRPLVLLSLWVDAQVAAAFPQIFHLTNILLHGVNAGLVYLLLRTLLPTTAGALLGALLFAAHPVHTESVAFVSGRTDLWAALFMLVAALLWRWDRGGPPARSPARRAGACVAFLCACLSKETAYLLPAVLLLWDRLESPPAAGAGGNAGWMRRNVPWVVLWGGAAGVSLALRWFVAGVGSPGGPPNSLSTLLGLWATYARLLVFPWPLRYYYREADLARGLLAALPAGILLALCLGSARKAAGRVGLMALAWIAVFLLPVAGPVRPSGAVLAERFLYLPSIGLSLAAGHWLGAAARTRAGRLVAYPLAALALAAMSFIVVRQAPGWRDNLTFYASFARSCPDVPLARFNLGNALREAGRAGEAIEEYQVAIRLNPGYEDAYLNLGKLYDLQDRFGEAEGVYRRLLSIRPESHRAYANLGHTLVDLGRWREALAAFARGSRLKPDDPLLRYNLGVALAHFGRWDEAIAELERTVELDARHAAAHFKLGTAYLQRGAVGLAGRQAAILDRLDPQKARQLRQALAGSPP